MGNKSIKFNILMNIILTMSNFIFPLITFPYVSRILLPSGTGKVSFATSFISYFVIFAQMGIPTYGIRACAKVRDNKEQLSRTAQELLIISVVMCIMAYVIFFMALASIQKLQQEKALYICMSSTILFTTIGVEWLYKATEQYGYITKRSVLFKFIALVLMFLLVHEKNDYLIYGIITIFASTASNILNLINIRKIIILKPLGNYNFKRHIKAVGIFFAMTCAATIYTNLDNVMLGFMKTDVDVGYYNAAVKVKTILVSIVTSFGAVLLPRVTYYVEHNKMDLLEKITKKVLNIVFVLSFPLIIYFIIFAKDSIFFLSGMAFEGSIMPMRVILPTVLFIGITNLLGIQILVPFGKEKIVLLSEVVGAIIDTIINIMCIPMFGATGAAFGTLIAEIFVFVVQFFYLRKMILPIFASIRYSQIIIGSILSGICCSLVLKLSASSIVRLILSSFVYFGVYLAFMLFNKNGTIVEIWNTILKKIGLSQYLIK